MLEVLCELLRAPVAFLRRVLRAGWAIEPIAPIVLEADSVDSMFITARSFLFYSFDEYV